MQTGEAADLFRSPLVVHPDDVEAEPQKFGRGRKPGSRNRTNSDLARLVQHIAGDVLLAKATVAALSLLEIKTMLGCTRAEAYKIRDKAQDDILPYIHSKMPLAIAMSGKVTSLNIGVQLGGGAQAAGPDAVAMMFRHAATAAAAEGFGVVALPEPESDDETET